MKSKLSIRSQITIVFAIILLLSFLLNFAINNVFLSDYYFIEKESLFRDIYSEINNSNSINKDIELHQICVANNISIITASENLTTDIYIATNDNYTIRNQNLEERLQNYIKHGLDDDIISTFGNTYQTVRAYDEYLELYYLEMYGTLDNGNYFLMRTPVSSVTESVNTINSFSYFSFIFCICVGIICINSLSNFITSPIEKLCNISQKMSNLDFTEMYTISATEEVNVLGQNLNHLSISLKASLQDLQTANNKLEKEISEKVQIDDMRKEFISNISHELKTPIAIIQGYAEGLKECTSDEDKEFYCEVIVDEAEKMDKMVKQLIELNRIEFGQDESILCPINLNHFVQNISKNLEVLLDGIHFEIIADKEYWVLFDEIKLEQIVTNYLTNAIHYVDDNKQIKIFILDGEKIELSVFNSGNHISDNDKDRIWEKFYKVDKARTRKYGGSGIGLSIVSAIMKKYGEDFGVENVNGGVEFFIYLKKYKK